jgi:terminase small subunit-like protein
LEGLEQLADSLLTVADEYDDVQRGRLKSENIRWILSKRKPLTYGDRLEVNLTQTVDIGAALLEAKSRAALPASYPLQFIESKVIDIIEDKPLVKTDSQSVTDPDNTIDNTKVLDDINIFD